MLLDEADIFLAQRTPTDIERNALVSGMQNMSYSFINLSNILTYILPQSSFGRWSTTKESCS